jgi:transcriptional regulator with XRE-family HTH domain
VEKWIFMSKSDTNKQPKVETLGRYVRRVMGEKQFTMREVEKRSGHAIADAYVANIVRGIAVNPSVDKLKALAVGLGEPEEAVFKVARGVPLDGAQEESNERWSAGGIVKAMEMVMASPERTEIVRTSLRMSLKELQEVLKYIEAMRPKGKD